MLTTAPGKKRSASDAAIACIASKSLPSREAIAAPVSCSATGVMVAVVTTVAGAAAMVRVTRSSWTSDGGRATVAGANPDASTCTLKLTEGVVGMTAVPSADVLCTEIARVPCSRVTRAPATTAPCGSSTLTVIRVWAEQRAAQEKTATKMRWAKRITVLLHTRKGLAVAVRAGLLA